MIKSEKKLLNSLTEKPYILILVLSFLAGAYMRFTMRYFVSVDSLGCYLPWYEEIIATGRIRGIGKQIGDYNVLYQTIMSLISYLPMIPLYAVKMFSIIFDLITAIVAGLFVYDKKGEGNKTLGSIAFAAIWLSPVAALNSSMWAQCDMVYTFFILLSLYHLRKERFSLSFILLGIAFAFKLQAILILPFYVLIWFKEKKFSFLHFFIVPAVMWLTTLPGIIGGRSLLSGFELYIYQTDEFKWAVVNYPSIWLSMVDNFLPAMYEYVHPIAMVTTLTALGGWMIYVIIQKKKLSEPAFMALALLLTYTAVFFLPSMHERYGFVYEILAILYCFKNKRSVIPCILLQVISICTYSRYLFGADTSLILLTVLNLAVYLWYARLFVSELNDCEYQAQEEQ